MNLFPRCLCVEEVTNGFIRELGCGLDTNCFGDDPHHYPERESDPDHNPDPGRTGVRRRSVLSEYFYM